jgi:hypothetical protein
VIIFQGCNDGNNDTDPAPETTRIPKGDEVTIIPTTNALDAQILLSPAMPTRKLVLPISALEIPSQNDYDTVITHITGDTERLAFEVDYWHCTAGYLNGISNPTKTDYCVHQIYLIITLTGDASFNTMEITEVGLSFNYQEVILPVNISIYDQRNYGSHREKEDPLESPGSDFLNLITQFDFIFTIDPYAKLTSIAYPDGGELKNLTISYSWNAVKMFPVDITTSCEMNIENEQGQIMGVYLVWDPEINNGYFARELIWKYVVDDIEYIGTFVVEFANSLAMRSVIDMTVFSEQ